jgi:leucyl-tRNA synthetase
MGPFDQGGPWNNQGIEGVWRFLNRAWALVEDHIAARGKEHNEDTAAELTVARLRHKIVKRVTDDYAALRFNTALAALMELTNGLNRARDEHPGVAATPAFADAAEALVVLLAPLAPHIAEELWHRLGHTTSVHAEPWPTYDEALTRDALVTVVIQVNGKMRDRLELAPDVAEDEVRALALASERVRAALDGRGVRKFIYVPGKLANVVG